MAGTSTALGRDAECETAPQRTYMRADDKNWDLMGLNLTLLSLAGVLPTPNIASSSWKLRFYHAYPSLMLVLYVMVFTAQCLALYKFWGDLDAITDNAFTMVGVFMCYIQAAYAVTNSRKILRLVDTLQMKLTPQMLTLASGEDQSIMVAKTARKTRALTWTMFVIVHGMLISWIAMPIIQKYSHEPDEEHRNADKPSPYFCFIIWLPFDATRSPTYEIVYTIQTICFLMACLYYTSMNTVFMTFIIHTATQFRGLAMSLRDMDKLFPAQDMGLEDRRLPSGVELNAHFIECIKHHQAIIRYVSGFKDASLRVTFASIISFGLQT